MGASPLEAQTHQALRTIQRAIEEAGSRLEDVGRTRVCVTDISHWGEVVRAHRAGFGHVCPATTVAFSRSPCCPRFCRTSHGSHLPPLPGPHGLRHTRLLVG